MHPFAMEMADEYLFGCVMTCIPSMSSMQLISVLCQSVCLALSWFLEKHTYTFAAKGLMGIYSNFQCTLGIILRYSLDQTRRSRIVAALLPGVITTVTANYTLTI